MKNILLPILVCLLVACNQPTSSNHKQNAGGTSRIISVFDAHIANCTK